MLNHLNAAIAAKRIKAEDAVLNWSLDKRVNFTGYLQAVRRTCTSVIHHELLRVHGPYHLVVVTVIVNSHLVFNRRFVIGF